MAVADVSHHCTILVGSTTYGFTLDDRDPWSSALLGTEAQGVVEEEVRKWQKSSN